ALREHDAPGHAIDARRDRARQAVVRGAPALASTRELPLRARAHERGAETLEPHAARRDPALDGAYEPRLELVEPLAELAHGRAGMTAVEAPREHADAVALALKVAAGAACQVLLRAHEPREIFGLIGHGQLGRLRRR